MEKFLNDKIAGQVRDVFNNLEEPVAVLVFGHKEDDYSQQTIGLLEEVVALSDKLSMEIYDPDEEPALLVQYGLDMFPALVVARKVSDALEDFGVRIFGLPAGHEFTSLIHSLIIVSQKESQLQPETIAFLQGLTEPVNLEVFSTPT